MDFCRYKLDTCVLDTYEAFVGYPYFFENYVKNPLRLRPLCICFFLKNGLIPASFVYFRYFIITISIIQIEKSVDSVLGIRAWVGPQDGSRRRNHRGGHPHAFVTYIWMTPLK